MVQVSWSGSAIDIPETCKKRLILQLPSLVRRQSPQGTILCECEDSLLSSFVEVSKDIGL